MSVINREAFEELIREYRENMYRLAFGILQNQHDAQDAVSEAVLKAYENLEKLRDKNKCRAWIMQITVNEARKLYKRQKRQFCVENIEQNMPAFVDDYHELWDVVMKLEAYYREVLLLFYYEQFSIAEIAKMLKVREGTVKSRLSRGREKLKQMLS